MRRLNCGSNSQTIASAIHVYQLGQSLRNRNGRLLESLSQAAATHALPAVPVVVVDPEILENMNMTRIYKVMSEHSMIFARAGMGGMTISPETDVFYPPYEVGFPPMAEPDD